MIKKFLLVCCVLVTFTFLNSCKSNIDSKKIVTVDEAKQFEQARKIKPVFGDFREDAYLEIKFGYIPPAYLERLAEHGFSEEKVRDCENWTEEETKKIRAIIDLCEKEIGLTPDDYKKMISAMKRFEPKDGTVTTYETDGNSLTIKTTKRTRTSKSLTIPESAEWMYKVKQTDPNSFKKAKNDIKSKYPDVWKEFEKEFERIEKERREHNENQ